MPRKKKTEEVVENVAPDAAPTQEGVNLSLQDLQALANILDLASRRGAFHAKEMSAVGDTYVKLTDFLSYVVEQQEEKEK